MCSTEGMRQSKLIALLLLAAVQTTACSVNSVGGNGEEASSVDAGQSQWPDDPADDDVAEIHFDAILYRHDPQVPKNYLAVSQGSKQFRLDFNEQDWMPIMDRMQTPWAQDPNGPLYDDPDTAVNESQLPLDAAYYRRDLARDKHFVAFVRGGTQYRYDYLSRSWKPKVDKIENGDWSDDPNAPFYDDPDTALNESAAPVDGMFYRLDPAKGMHILSFVRGSMQHRYDFRNKEWLDKIDRRSTGQWSSDINSPFHEDPDTTLIEATAPIDATFYREDQESGEHHIGFVRGSLVYTYEIADRSWSQRVDLRSSTEWSASPDAPFYGQAL